MLRATITAPRTATTAKPGRMRLHTRSWRIRERSASITYVTGLNVAATSMGLVSRSRGTKFGVMKSSGKKTRPPELVAAALASRLDDEHALHRLGDETAKHERCARNGAARSLSK